MGSSRASIVHIATDEKFIDAAYDVYNSAFPRENRFLILMENEKSRPEYVSTERNYEYVAVNETYLEDVSSMVEGAQVLVFHGLTEAQAKLVLLLKNRFYLLWTVFGMEVYNNTAIEKKDIYGPLTQKTFFSRNLSLIKDMLRPLFYRLWKGRTHSDVLIKKAMKEVDYISSIYEEEVTHVREMGLLKEDAQWIKFTYYPLDIILKGQSEFIEGQNILLGNSAFPSCNHLEAMDILKELDLDGRKVITPLSYGQLKYKEAILERGKALLGENFRPLLEYLPLEEYQQLTQSCGIVIMNNYRQQAVGNILDMLYRGAKVYLSERNTFYHYLKRLQCTVFSMEKLAKERRHIYTPLSPEQKQMNRQILSEEISLQNICESLRRGIEPLLIQGKCH